MPLILTGYGGGALPVSGDLSVTAASATALTVGRLGATTPAFQVDAATAVQVTGLKVTGAATGGTVAVEVIQAAGNANLTIDAKGSGTIGIGVTSSGAITLGRATTITTGNFTVTAGGVIVTAGNVTLTAGTIVVGGTAATNILSYLTGAVTSAVGNTTYGVYVDNTVGNASTTSTTGIYSSVQTQAAAFTCVSGYAFYASTPIVGSTSAITNSYGLYVANQGASGVTNAYGIYIPAQSGAATLNIGFYNAGTTSLVGATTVAATTATPAAGSTTARLLFGTTAGFGIYYGSGAPTVSAAQGSLYLRSDGDGVANRAYINSNGSTTWTSIATAG